LGLLQLNLMHPWISLLLYIQASANERDRPHGIDLKKTI